MELDFKKKMSVLEFKKIITLGITKQKLLLEEISYANLEVQEDKEFNDKSKQELEEKIRQYNANLALEKDRLAQEKKQDSISNRFKQQEINIKRIQATKAVNSSKKHK